MLRSTQGFTYNKFEKPNDWPKVEDTFDYKYDNGKLIGGNKNLFLSGPVNYTVVGTPTIVDNMVTNTSTSNCLLIQKNDLVSKNSYEYVVNFKAGNQTTQTGSWRYITFPMDCKSSPNQQDWYGMYGYGLTGTLRLFAGFKSDNSIASGLVNFVSGTIYWVKWHKENGVQYVSYSTDGTNYTEVANDGGADNTIWPTQVWFDGIRLAYSEWEGAELYLNNCYIKVNGSLYFYGKNYTTKNMVPVPAGLEYNNTTTPSIGWVDVDTSSATFQQFTAAPEGTMIGKDDTHSLAVETYQDKGIVDYTVVGNPTIVDVVVSGFSTTDYVQTSQQAPLSTDIIYVLKFKTEQSGTQQHILRLGGGHCAVYLYNNKICIEGTDENGTYFATSGTSTLAVGTYYFVKMVVSGTTVNISISTDGVNYTTEITHGYSLAYQSAVILGSNNPYYLAGSIDLKETYIKVNGQYWFHPYPNSYPKLVGPVNYTVVGSPTIVDGVASGFSASNYIKTASQISSSANSIYLNLRFSLSSVSDWQTIMSISASVLGRGFEVDPNNQAYFSYLNTNNENTIIILGTIQNNTFYDFILQAEGTSLQVKLMQGITEIANVTKNDCLLADLLGQPQFGYLGFSVFQGSIDLNHTYIKINNTLWFGKENWKPSTYTDNSIYLLTGHKSNYSQYNDLGFTPTISNSGNYNVWIDNQLVNSSITSECDIIWQNLNLTTGYTITSPESLKAHIIKIEPTDNHNSIIGYRTNRIASSGTENQGILQAIFNLDNAINLSLAFIGNWNVSNNLLKSIDAKGNTINTSDANYLNFYGANLEHLPKIKTNGENSLINLTSLSKVKYLNVDCPDNFSQDCITQDSPNLEKIDLNNKIKSGDRILQNCFSLKQLPKLNLNEFVKFGNLSDFITNASNLQPTDIDLSNNKNLKILGIYGDSNNRIDGLKSLIVSNEAPFDSTTSPQINVNYTGLDRNALVNLFNSLPTVSNGQTISIIGCIGTSSLTNDDKAIATNKGWTLQDS